MNKLIRLMPGHDLGSIVRLVFIGASLVASVGLASCTRTVSVNPQVLTTKTAPDAKKVMGNFATVCGANYQRAAITSGNSERGYYSESSDYGGAVVHNYVFFDLERETLRRLLPTNDYLILTTSGLTGKTDNEKTSCTLWYLYSIVKTDTNGDKKLSSQDRQTLAVSDAGGAGYAEILSDVEHVYGYALQASNTLFVFYLKNSSKYMTKIDLSNKQIITTNDFPPLGDDVQ